MSVAVFAVVVWDSAVRAEVLSVPAEYGTIQAAIDAAEPGDEVVIADGTYWGPGNRDLDFGGRDITVRSASGDPETCVIDCEGAGRGFYFHSGETGAAVVHGLTIRNGYVGEDSRGLDRGGAVYLINSSPTIANNVITQNSADGLQGDGGGVYLYNSFATITNNTIEGNSAKRGGGLYLQISSPIVADNTILGNVAYSYGGGVFQYGGLTAYVRNTIRGNHTVEAQGGGLYLSGGLPRIWNNTIAENTAIGARGFGGGIYLVSSSARLANSTITGNRARQGAGLYLYASSPMIVNNTVAGNAATHYGGGIFLYESSPVIGNNSITGNTGSYNGGLYLHTSTPTILNTVIAFNSSGIYRYDIGYPTLRYNCVYGNTDYNFKGMNAPTGLWGNIASHPRFSRNPDDGGDGWGDDPGTAGIDEGANDDFGDLKLLPGSPCIDAGENAAVPADILDLDGDGDADEPWPFDVGGLMRFVDDPTTPDTGSGTPPIVDMGAHEFQAVDVPGDLDGDGDVDADDYAVFRSAFGSCEGGVAFVPEADYDGDGCITLADYQAWLTDYRAFQATVGNVPGRVPVGSPQRLIVPSAEENTTKPSSERMSVGRDEGG